MYKNYGVFYFADENKMITHVVDEPRIIDEELLSDEFSSLLQADIQNDNVLTAIITAIVFISFLSNFFLRK